ncbi:hypothetical protein BSKO_05512 [Bryopsis sp. KO-2023]|nr:hypothetical protein BSKO_05512 [Bryopsis sp. KO-2023]
MLNTIIKRVTIMQFQLRLQKSMDSALSPKTPTGDDRLAGIQETGNDSPKSKEPLEGSESPAPGSEHRAPVLYSTEEGEVPSTSALTAELASLAEKEDIKGLAALEKAEQSRNMDEQPAIKVSEESKDSEETHAESSDAQVASTSGSMLAGMTPASGSTEDYYRQGKLLALELLVKVFENSGHKWDNVRLPFCEQLRLPLCLVLVRNCSPSEAKSFQFAVRLFCAIMLQPQLRLGLKAELGALYPLLLMRPLESRPLDPGLLFVALSSVKRQRREPQMQISTSAKYMIHEENKPEALGAFLRKHRDELDETMMKEYLGHHDDMPIAVMHAYIDMEQYMSLTIDEALRKLLAGFRIPGMSYRGRIAAGEAVQMLRETIQRAVGAERLKVD